MLLHDTLKKAVMYKIASPQWDEIEKTLERAVQLAQMTEDQWLSHAELDGMDVVACDYRQHKKKGIAWVPWKNRPMYQDYTCQKCGYSFGRLDTSAAALSGLVGDNDQLCSNCVLDPLQRKEGETEHEFNCRILEGPCDGFFP